MKRGSRNRLQPWHAERFPGDTLFDRLARTVCAAGCLPRKELFEAWEVARRAHRRLRDETGPVVDLAAGHGLAAWVALLLNPKRPFALAVEPAPPASAAKLAEALVERWPKLAGRVRFETSTIETVELPADATLLSIHACGALTDRVIDRALEASAPVAVLPCCHDLATCDAGGLAGWMDGPLAIDATRAARLRGAGYRVFTQTLPADITPKNRLLLATPLRDPPAP